MKNRCFLQHSQIKEDSDFLRQRYLLAVTQDSASLVIRGLWASFGNGTSQAVFHTFSLSFHTVENRVLSSRIQLLAFASHPHHLPFQAFVAVGVAPFEAPEPKHVTQQQQRSRKQQWPCSTQQDGVDLGGPLLSASQCLPSVPQWMRWGQLLPPLMQKGRMLWVHVSTACFSSRPAGGYQGQRLLSSFINLLRYSESWFSYSTVCAFPWDG